MKRPYFHFRSKIWRHHRVPRPRFPRRRSQITLLSNKLLRTVIYKGYVIKKHKPQSHYWHGNMHDAINSWSLPITCIIHRFGDWFEYWYFQELVSFHWLSLPRKNEKYFVHLWTLKDLREFCIFHSIARFTEMHDSYYLLLMEKRLLPATLGSSGCSNDAWFSITTAATSGRQRRQSVEIQRFGSRWSNCMDAV